MAVNEVKLTPEQKTLNAAEQFAGEEAFAKKLAESFDLPSNLANSIEDTITEEKRVPKKKEEEPEEEVEEVADEAAEESEEEVPVEESEEDLIPKSKVQSRIDELTRQKRELEARLRKVEEENEKRRSPKDSDLEKLEAMSDEQLRTLKRQVKAEQMAAVNAQDRTKLNELLDLEDKIEGVMKDAPVRFSSQQVSKFNSAVADTASDPDIKDFKKASVEIFKAAQQIFSESPELQASVTGQARAWNLAVKHYKQLFTLTEGKSKTNELERTVNNLKKKVSVDTGLQKGSEKAADDRRVFQKAKHGTEDDKLNFFKKSVISPEMFEPNKA